VVPEDASSENTRSARQVALACLAHTVGAGPQTVEQVRGATGIKPTVDSVHKALSRLVDAGDVSGLRRGIYGLVDKWPDGVTVRSFGHRMRRTQGSKLGATAIPIRIKVRDTLVGMRP
jgi:hypothetical protein